LDITPYFSGIMSAAVFVIGGYLAMKNANEKRFAIIESKQAAQDEKILRALEEVNVSRDLATQMAALSTKMDDLVDDVRKHNNVVERTYKIEQDVKTAFHRIDELRDDIKAGK